MQITGLRTRTYEFTAQRPIGDANAPGGEDFIVGHLLFVDTDAGLTGVAPLGSPAIGALEHLVIGEDPRGVVGLWKRLVDAVFKRGNAGQDKVAIAALDLALWDLKAKANGEPLWRTLGAREGRVKAYASGIDMCLGDEDLANFYRGMANKGVDGGKLKVGLDLDDDLRRLQIVKDALSRVSSRPTLMIDSNEYWSPKQAIRWIAELERHFDLTWVEEPARRWDYRGLRQVSRSIRAAVASGENLNHIGDYYPLVANQAVDVVQLGEYTSGITGAMQVAHLAYGFDLPVSVMNCPGSYMAHLATALPNHWMMEVVNPGWDVVFSVDTRIEDGDIVIGDTPGLGITVDEHRLAELEVAQPSRRSGLPFPRREGAGLHVQPLSPAERAARTRGRVPAD